MAITYGFYNSLNGDKKYNARDMSRIFDGIINDGVFMSVGTSMIVQAAEGMIVNVGIGRAWFNGTWTHNDAILPLRIPDSDLLLNRIDAIVLEVNANDNVRVNDIKVISGTPATVPVSPTLQKDSNVFQYPLAYIQVNAVVTEITQANITNMVGTSETPFVTGILKTMDIDALVVQWGQQWEEWKEGVESDNIIWSAVERQEFDDWCTQTKADLDAWIGFYQNDMELIKTGYEQYVQVSESDFILWFEAIKNQLSEDAAGNLQNQMNDLAKLTFDRYYNIYNKTTIIDKANGVITETTSEAVSTTTIESTVTEGRLITTICVPTEGNYKYIKTVSIELVGSEKQIIETYTTEIK